MEKHNCQHADVITLSIFSLLKKTLLISLFIFPCLIELAWSMEEKTGRIVNIGDIEVREAKSAPEVELTPIKTVIDTDLFQSVGIVQNFTDILKSSPAFDFRGQSDLVPSNDTLQMRGFGSLRFVTAVDGLTVEKSGFGSAGNYAVDYALFPLGPIEKIEIIYGPHSCLYPGQSIGGVVNLITRRPKQYLSLKPEIQVASSVRSYNTQNHSIDVAAGAGSFNYGLGYQKYHTDGYLRHNETDIDTVFTRLGWQLPSNGFLTFLYAHTDQNGQQAVNNDPTAEDYDPDYPTVTQASFKPWQDTVIVKECHTFRLNGAQPTFLGTLKLGAYYERERQDRQMWTLNEAKEMVRGDHLRNVIWEKMGARLHDEFRLADNHTTTIGIDGVMIYTEYKHAARHKRLERFAGFLQHAWDVTPDFNVTAGVRYEDVQTAIFNRLPGRNGQIIGYYNTAVETDYIDKEYSGLSPKSFFTYRLDHLAAALRDTSVSLGVSKIWRAPTSGMEMQGAGPAFYLDEEHGMGYDAILTRRLFGNLNMRMVFSHYEIEDFIVWNNMKYAEYNPSTAATPVPAGMEYLDAKVNLDKVIRHGFEVEFNGDLLDDLSFYAGYSWQDFESKGDEPVAKEELDDRAEHRVCAGLRFNPIERTTLMLDYKFQSNQVAYNAVEVAPGQWAYTRMPMEAYHLFDFSIEQMLFKKYKSLQNGRLAFFVNNLFDTAYMDSRGYPMTDRTYGVRFSFEI